MEILDDQGRLFGVVNVVDALVVLLVLAVVIAGVALLTGESSPTTDPEEVKNPKYITLTVGPTEEVTSNALATAQNVTVLPGETVYTVADTFRTPAPTTDAAVTVTKLAVPPGADRLRIGDRLRFEVAEYGTNGTITAFASAPGLDTGTDPVTVRANVSSSVASTIRPGDRYRIGAATVATLTAVQPLGPTGGAQRELLLGLDLATVRADGVSRFATHRLRLGVTVPFRTETYSFSGEIADRRSSEIPTREQVVQVEANVSRATAAAVQVGDTIESGNRTLAQVTRVASYPTGDPDQRRLALGLTLQTLVTEDGPSFLGTPIRVGTTVPLETGDYRLDGRITSLGEQPTGDPVEATLAIEWRNVRPAQADGLAPSMTATHRGADARIATVSTKPATVILESEDGRIFAREHPVNEDVDLTLSVEARRTDDGLWFHGRPVQRGETVVLDFGSITVRGEVTRFSVDG